MVCNGEMCAVSSKTSRRESEAREDHPFSEKTHEYFIKTLNDLPSERYARESTLDILDNIVWENRKVEACLVDWDETNTQNKTQYDQSSYKLSKLDLSDETAARCNLRR